jgi:hypothetical protein
MDRATLFLRTALFSANTADAHIPAGVSILDVEIIDKPAGALTVRAIEYRDSRNRKLDGAETTLSIPWSKIDHLLVQDS